MKRYNGSELFPSETTPTAVALGVFDGVHLGHLELIRRTRDAAARINGKALAYTFEPHPVRVLSPSECPQLLTTLDQKLKLLDEAGIDAVIVEPFSREFAHMDAGAFFRDVIVSRMRAAAVIVGYDFTFGLHRQGTIEMLEVFGREQGIETIVVPAIFARDTLISSTVIRRMISHGEVDHARELLGRPYAIEGDVIAGRGIGSELGARTANIVTKNELLPQNGVYVTRTAVELRETGVYGKSYASITSIGDNPTFPDSPFTIETHLIDVETELLGKAVSIEFLAFMRGQVRFDSQDALKAQIAKDINAARTWHRTYSPPL
ncbi:MAG: bifunctional riboflavin kinase/FAD synthetase [bacterium]